MNNTSNSNTLNSKTKSDGKYNRWFSIARVLFAFCILFAVCFKLFRPSNIDIAKKFDVQSVGSVKVFFDDGNTDLRKKIEYKLSSEEIDAVWTLISEPRYEIKGDFDGDYGYDSDTFSLLIFDIEFINSEGKKDFLTYRTSNIGNISIHTREDFGQNKKQKRYSTNDRQSDIELFDKLKGAISGAYSLST